jgi:hypothetical protein
MHPRKQIRKPDYAKRSQQTEQTAENNRNGSDNISNISASHLAPAPIRFQSDCRKR